MIIETKQHVNKVNKIKGIFSDPQLWDPRSLTTPLKYGNGMGSGSPGEIHKDLAWCFCGVVWNWSPLIKTR